MYVGQLVELTTTAALFARPRHLTPRHPRRAGSPIRARPAATWRWLGEVANPANPADGLLLSPSLLARVDMCRTRPALRKSTVTSCGAIGAEELTLAGA
jgi:peptide/nickel transport system ATP-binding protein